MESVEVCKKEINESLSILRGVAEEVGNTDYELYIINAVEIIKIFTEILIEHTKR